MTSIKQTLQRPLRAWAELDDDLRFRIERWCVAFGIAIPVLIGYFVLTTYNVARYEWGGQPTIALWTTFDSYIPLVPEAFFPYSLYYALAVMPAFLARTRRDLVEMGVSFAIVTGVAWTAFLLVPVRMEYPELTCSGLSCNLLRGLHETDGGVNVFPSLHVGHSMLVASMFWSYRERVPTWIVSLVAAMALAVSASTVLLKQHYVVDIPAGVLLAVGGWALTRWAVSAFYESEATVARTAVN